VISVARFNFFVFISRYRYFLLMSLLVE